MNYKKKTIHDLDCAGKRVLVRCDFNVPTDGNGAITDDARIVKTLPTIRALLEKGAAVILCSHKGRPKNGPEEKYSLKVVWQRLQQLLPVPVHFVEDVIGEAAQQAAAALRPGEVLLLENVRFLKGETKNDDAIAQGYAALAELFVNDAFGSCHRAHASTAGVTRYLPAVSGLLVQRELEIMGGVMESPRRPFVLIMGGSKVSDKISVIDNLVDKVDAILIGGGMSYTFSRAQGGEIGNSLCEEDSLDYCRTLLEKAGTKIHLPVDTVAAEAFAADAPHSVVPDGQIPQGTMGLDIGPETAARFARVIREAGTVIWNGPMGVFEFPAFAAGTQAVGRAVAESDCISVIGGGDSAAAVEQMGLAEQITHISTGGGASLDFFAGHVLPGVDCLLDAE